MRKYFVNSSRETKALIIINNKDKDKYRQINNKDKPDNSLLYLTYWAALPKETEIPQNNQATPWNVWLTISFV